jgi:AraC family transcriptional regulator
MSEFDEHFRRSALAIHPHERRGGGSLPTRMIRLDSPAHEVVDPPTSDLVVALVIRSRGAVEWSWDGAKANFTGHRGSLTLGVTPLRTAGHFAMSGPSSILIVALPFEAMAIRLEADLLLRRDLGRLHDAYTAQPRASALCQKLWSLSQHSSQVADLQVDLLSERLVAELAGPVGTSGAEAARGGLGPLEHARVCAAADQHAAEVADLAHAAMMPVRTFRRRFHASFGMPPHRWLIARRIEQARDLLRRKELRLSQIALDLGFASQAHFTDIFRREVGISPGRFRRDANL